MAIVGGTEALTLTDLAQRLGPDKKIMKITELLKLKNGIIMDIPWMMCNDGTGHKSTIRTELPEPAWRLLNYGVPKGKSRTAQVRDTTGTLAIYGETDVDLANLYGNKAEFLMSDQKGFIQGFDNTFAETLFYGNTAAEPQKFLGLSPRFSDLSADNAQNIIDAGGTGSDNTSIWLIAFGADTIHGIYPQGLEAGLKIVDKGQETVLDDVGNQYEAYRIFYDWKMGLAVLNWEYIVRIANIDVSDLTKDATGSSADLVDLLSQALEQIKDTNTGNLSFYCNRTVKSFLRRQTSNKVNVNLTLDNATGKHVLTVDGVSVKLCESLLNTEATVS